MSPTSLFLYRALSRFPWPRSFIGKIFLSCFIGTHVPLVGYLVYLLLAEQAVSRGEWLGAGVVLGATLVGTAFSLTMLYLLLAPVRVATASLQRYMHHRNLPSLPVRYDDEVGQLMATVQETLEQIDSRVEHLAQEASTDPLTGVGNRRWLERAAERRMAASVLLERPVALMMIDLDHFKVTNDRFGHVAGDAVLRQLAQTVGAEIRPLDLFARVGGEEFCLVLFDATPKAAASIAERLRLLVADIRLAQWPELAVTASFGVTRIDLSEHNIRAAMQRADQALYQAKRAGRNRIVGDE
jgi:diguanylate cyclase (GGDEF)-like protein